MDTRGAVILALDGVYQLSAANKYRIKFNGALMEGTGISIDKDGVRLRFSHDGMYRFELAGTFIPEPATKVTWEISCKHFPLTLQPFSQVTLPPAVAGQITCPAVSTLLRIKTGQIVTIHLRPANSAVISLLPDTRLQIFAVA
jgi:hypothetical protein